MSSSTSVSTSKSAGSKSANTHGSVSKPSSAQDVALKRVQLTYPVTCPRESGPGFASATAQFHVDEKLQGAGRCVSIRLRDRFVVLQMPGCVATEVPLSQVAWLVRA